MKFGDNRLGRNPVRLIGVNAPFQPALQFGREYSANDDPRLASANSWGDAAMQGRASVQGRGEVNSIKQPLPTRQQTAFAHQLSPQMQSMLRGGMRPIQNQGRGASPEPQRLHLHSVHLGQAIGAPEQRAATVSAVTNVQGQIGLRRVVGDV